MLFGETYTVTARMDEIEDVGNVARDRLNRLCVCTFRCNELNFTKAQARTRGRTGSIRRHVGCSNRNWTTRNTRYPFSLSRRALKGSK